MTALRLTRSPHLTPGDSPGAILSPGAAVIPIEQAAQRSGKSIGHLSRLCRDSWHARNLATLEKPAVGGKAKWFVAVSADPAFALVKFPDHIPFDARTLSEDQRRQLFVRKRIIDRWETARGVGVTMGFIEAQITEQFLQHLELEEGRKVNRSTLFRWLNGWRAEGLAGLVDRRWQKSSGEGDGNPFLDCLKTYYLSTARPSAKSCWLAASFKAKEQGWKIIGYRAACLFLQKLPAAAVIRRREGADAYTAKVEPSIERDYSTLHSNEQWVGDHHQFDVIVQHQGKLLRPWITAWMDMRSRLIAGWCIYAHDPNSNSILSALRGGILDRGAPELSYIDNGKDFSAQVFHGSTKWQRRNGRVSLPQDHMTGILNHLQIKARFCWAYHGQSKPIERWFNTLEDQFGRTWPTYCGKDPAHKPEELQMRLSRGEAPRLADFIDVFSDYLTSVYHKTPHEGDGMGGRSPEEVFAASWNGFSKRTASADLLDLLLMRQTKEVVVRKGGVTHDGLSYGQYSPELIPLLNQKVYLRIDERDVTRVQVWTPEDRFVCIAGANERLPANASDQEKREAIAAKQSHKKLQREFFRKRPQITESLPDTMIRARHAQLTPGEDTGGVFDPPPLRPIRSTLEDQLPAVRSAAETPMKIAVGAENLDSRFIYTPSEEADDE